MKSKIVAGTLLSLLLLGTLTGCSAGASEQTAKKPDITSLSSLVTKALAKHEDGESLISKASLTPEKLPAELGAVAQDESTKLEKGTYQFRFYCAGEGTATYRIASDASELSGNVECKPNLGSQTVTVKVGDDLLSTQLLTKISLSSDKKINAVGGWAVYRS